MLDHETKMGEKFLADLSRYCADVGFEVSQDDQMKVDQTMQDTKLEMKPYETHLNADAKPFDPGRPFDDPDQRNSL